MTHNKIIVEQFIQQNTFRIYLKAVWLRQFNQSPDLAERSLWQKVNARGAQINRLSSRLGFYRLRSSSHHRIVFHSKAAF